MELNEKLEKLKKHIKTNPKVIGNDFRVWSDVVNYLNENFIGKSTKENAYNFYHSKTEFEVCEICNQPKTKFKNFEVGYICKPKCVHQINYNSTIKNCEIYTKKECLDKLDKITVSGNVLKTYLFKHVPILLESLIRNTSFIVEPASFYERIYCLKNNIIEKEKCSECGVNEVKFNVNQNKYIMCSSKCSNNSEKRHSSRKQNCLEKYGVDHYSKTKEYKEKYEKTMLEKYGKKHNWIKDENEDLRNCDKTKIKNHGSLSYNNIEKTKETNLENHNKEYYFETNKFQEKSKKTKFERYGDEHYVNLEKYKKTCIKKYGYDNSFKVPEIKEKILNTLEEKYGVTNAFHVTKDKYYSKVSQEMCWMIYEKLDDELKGYCKFAELNSEFFLKTDNIRTTLDFVNLKNKIVVEFNGDFWHMNPSIFNEDDINPMTKMDAKTHWLNDKNRIKEIESKGFKVITIWESDFYDNRENIIKDIVSALI